VEREDHHVVGGTGMSDRSAQRRVECPAGAGSATDEDRAEQQREGRDEKPEAEVVVSTRGSLLDQQSAQRAEDHADLYPRVAAVRVFDGAQKFTAAVKPQSGGGVRCTE